MLAYDKLNSDLYYFIMKDLTSCFHTFAIVLSYSHDGINFERSIEVFEIDSLERSVCWFNDWWEGQPYIRIIGWLDIDKTFDNGDYHVLVKEFNDD